MSAAVSPADLLFWAEQVRKLAEVDDVAGCADVIARHLEWQAQQMLAADITEATP